MRKSILLLAIAAIYCQITGCQSSSPEKYFDIAVLNCNMMHGFAGRGLQRELESPPLQMINGDRSAFASMQRKEVLENRIASIVSNYERVKKLKETKDSKEVLEASISIYEYVLPVYNNEYRELIRLYDEGGSKEAIVTYTQIIHDRYYPGFAELFDKLIAAGKPYAEKHDIKINWDIQTSPE